MSVEFRGWFVSRPLRLTWGAPPYRKLAAGLNVGKVGKEYFCKNISDLKINPGCR